MKEEQKRTERQFSTLNNFNVRKVETGQKQGGNPLQKAVLPNSATGIEEENTLRIVLPQGLTRSLRKERVSAPRCIYNLSLMSERGLRRGFSLPKGEWEAVCASLCLSL